MIRPWILVEDNHKLFIPGLYKALFLGLGVLPDRPWKVREYKNLSQDAMHMAYRSPADVHLSYRKWLLQSINRDTPKAWRCSLDSTLVAVL
jgi:hypothetical protein